MLNHIWTLLINENVTSSVRGRLGELPQTPGYKKVSLTSGLNSIKRCLYGSRPDLEMLNYRTHQFIKCLLNSSLSSYAYTFDSRNTYDESITDFLGKEVYLPKPKLISGSTSLSLNIHGLPVPPDSNGIIRHSYSLITSGNDLILTNLLGISTTITGIAANEQKKLGDSGYLFSLSNPNQTQSWLIEFLNKPTFSLKTLINDISSVGEPALNELFGIAVIEPYITFKNVFFNAQDLPLKCSAVCLALAYRTEEIRKKFGVGVV